jgi:integrase
VTKVLEEIEHYKFYGESRHTWKEAVVSWAQEAHQTIKPSTYRRYVVSLGQLRSIMDNLFIDQIDYRTVSSIARRSGASNATRRRDLTAVSVVLRWCVAHGWREDNPAHSWDRSVIKERRDPVTLPEVADIDRVAAAAPGNFARMVRFAQYTGMRQEEIASLEWSQVDLRRAAVNLIKTKTSRPRSIPLDDRAIGTLAGAVPHIATRYVFWHGMGGDRYLNVASRFALIASKNALRRFNFHALRHWYAVDYLRRGGSIYTLQKILGHSSIKTTEIYLAYLTPKEQEISKHAVENIRDYMRGVLESGDLS